MDLDFIKKLYDFNLQCNEGFVFDGIDIYDKYTIVYHNKITDCWYNNITDLKVKDENEFKIIMKEAKQKIKEKNRKVSINILPFMKEIYKNKEKFFPETQYKIVSDEVWQIYTDFDNVDNIQTNCNFDIKLEKITDMKLFGKQMVETYQTDNSDDPYGDLDSVYQEVYENFKQNENGFTTEFFLVKIDEKIVGITEGVNNNEIYGIYSLAIKDKFRGQGIGKEVVKEQLKICKNKKLKVAFLQTEDGFYPADMYRKIGFTDVCHSYIYREREG